MNRNHKISQNFLSSPKFAMMLVGHTNIKKRDFTLDIGAGSGVFTYALSKKSGEVLAIESDSAAYKKLEQNTRELENVKIKHFDFLKLDLHTIPKNYKVCSNIPFHLSSQIIQKLISADNRAASINLVLQKQFAKKLLITDRNFTSALGIKIYPLYSTKIKQPLRRTDFTPPPAVETVFFEMKLRERSLINFADLEYFNEVVDESFHSSIYFAKITKQFSEVLGKKPSELPGEKWIEIFNNLNLRK